MAKSLSLKKGSHSAPPKNQKPITQFFKNVPSGSSQPAPKAEKKHSEAKSSETSSNKRKASSPIQVDEVKDKGNPSNGPQDKSSKKVKLGEDIQLMSIPNSEGLLQAIKSPEKENHKLPVNGKINLEVLDDDTISRSPLSTIESNSELLDKSTVNHENDESSPKKIVKNNIQNKLFNQSPGRSKTPKKSPITELRRSPRIAKLLSLEKNQISSPTKTNGAVKALDFNEHKGEDGDFGDEWELNDFEEEIKEDLDLNVMQRCEVISVIRHPTQIELKLKNANNHRGTCFIEGFWLDTPLITGEIVSVLASSESGKFVVNNTSGLLVLRPDHLLSSTSVVAGVFCKRKAVLQERWRGIDSANTAMTIGILIHELVQTALTNNINDLKQINAEADRIIKESIQMLYDAGLSQEEVRVNMQAYTTPLAEFMQTYVAKNPSKSHSNQNQKGKWQGHVNKILDIEENLCCPQLGLKGKIDATLEVTIHDKKGNKAEMVPLELKSGKASMSAEHRGQLVLYGMMLALQRGADPARAEQRGLLLYLKDRVELREVSCGHPERRDLLILRNQLANDLAAGPGDVDPEQITDIEDASILLQQRLPEPIHRESVCSKCPYLTLCSLHLWHTSGPSVSEDHPLSKLQSQALGHLSPAHVQYFLHWTALLKAEERVQQVNSPLHSLWTDSAEKREKRGTCAANLHLKSVERSDNRYLHVFLRRSSDGCDKTNMRGPQEGEFSIVSIEKRPWIAAGVVTYAKDSEIHILLERDLSRRLPKSTQFYIDTYESYATTVQNLTNLGVLMEDSDRAQSLRSLIIDRETPSFEAKLSREVGRVGSKLMRALNIEQQRAVLRALAAGQFALLKGLPGTGKTQTISVLIQMLVALKMRVLVTAHTHSAVDNVLARLPDTIKVMRLGPKSRVAAKVVHRCEQQLAAASDTPQKLEELYESMDVVGVTCLGANHAMLARTTFDMCIVDEATQVPQCTVLRPLFAAKRFVLVGDPDQLPPVVRSKAARRLGMEESLFHRLMSEQATSTLKLQYRMNEPLASLANRIAYKDQLKCANATVADARLKINIKNISPLTEQAPWLSVACSPATEHAALFLDMQPEGEAGRSCANRHEAAVVLALVDAFIKGGVPSEHIGVMAPFREQVTLLRRSLAGRADASTVDQFQGRDKPVILLSCTRRKVAGRDQWQVKEGEVLNDQRRLAVSVTRAKHKLIVLGDSRALRRYDPLSRLIDACQTISLPAHQIEQQMDRYSAVLGS